MISNMDKWLISEKEFQNVRMEFEQNLKGKATLSKDGDVFGILDWETKKVEKEKKVGFFTKTIVKETFYCIESIQFVDGRDNKIKEWVNEKGLMCTEIGVGELLRWRNRYTNMKKQLRTLGHNIVKLPKRKKKDEKN